MASITSSTSNSPTRATPAFGLVARAALLGAGIATAGNLILLLLAGLLNIPLNVVAGPPGPGVQPAPLNALQVIVMSVLPALVGGLLYFVLTKISAKAGAIFIVIAVIVALLSLLAIFAQPVSASGIITLILMHLVAAAAITWALVTQTRA